MANDSSRILRASIGSLPNGFAATHQNRRDSPDPPLSGLPETHNGKPLAWTLRRLESWECVACGRPQEEYTRRKDIEAVLCGRCSMILADAAGPQEDPLLPEERAVMNRRNARAKARRR